MSSDWDISSAVNNSTSEADDNDSEKSSSGSYTTCSTESSLGPVSSSVENSSFMYTVYRQLLAWYTLETSLAPCNRRCMEQQYSQTSCKQTPFQPNVHVDLVSAYERLKYKTFTQQDVTVVPPNLCFRQSRTFTVNLHPT